MSRTAQLQTAGSTRCAHVPTAFSRRLLSSTALLTPFVLVETALADTPSLDALKQLSYDQTVAPKASIVAADAARKAADLNLNGIEDATPLVAGLAVGILLVGGAIAFIANGSKGPAIKSLSPAAAVKLLEDDATLQLVDIRTKDEMKESGSPDLRKFKKSPINSTYQPRAQPAKGTAPQSGTVTIGWPERLCRIPKIGTEKPVLLLDADGSVSPAAAKALAASSADRPSVSFVNGGAEAWLAAELPWKEPLQLGINFETLKGFDVSGVAAGTEQLVAKYKENPNLVNGGIAVVAIAAASAFLFTEVEAVLQIVGVLGAVQFLASRLLFAEDRQQTFGDVKYLIKDKIDAGQAGDDLRRLADKVLEADSAEGVTETARSMGGVDMAMSDNGTIKISNSTRKDPSQPGKEGAQSWINAWRDQDQNPEMNTENGTVKVTTTGNVFTDDSGTWPPRSPPPVVTNENVPSNVASAQKWIAAWREKAGEKQAVLR